MNHQTKLSEKTKFAHSYYAILGLHPSTSYFEIRQAYRELSKIYHPDTTKLPALQAKRKFQELNEAYATLSNQQKRSLYDLKIGYSTKNINKTHFNLPNHNYDNRNNESNSAYLDANDRAAPLRDRPLSGGEIFAILMMGLTLVGCLILALTIAWLRN